MTAARPDSSQGRTSWTDRAPVLIARLWRRESGSTALEFAFLAPAFLIMSLGVIEVSRAFWIQGNLQYAVQETGRFAMANTAATSSELITYARTKLDGVGSTQDTVFATATDTAGTMNFITITASYGFQSNVPLLQMPAITLTARSRVPLLQ